MTNHEVDYGPNHFRKPEFKTLTVYGTFNKECHDLLVNDPDIHGLILFGTGPISLAESEMITGSAKNIDWMNITGENHTSLDCVHSMPNLRNLRLKFVKKPHDLSYIHWKSSSHLKKITVVNAIASPGDLSTSNVEHVFIEDFTGSGLTFESAPSLKLINCTRLKKVKTLCISKCKNLETISFKDVKSICSVESDCSPQILFLNRTTPAIAKALSSLRPRELSLEGKWEYKNILEAQSDYPNSAIQMF